eukprot:UN14525
MSKFVRGPKMMGLFLPHELSDHDMVSKTLPRDVFSSTITHMPPATLPKLSLYYMTLEYPPKSEKQRFPQLQQFIKFFERRYPLTTKIKNVTFRFRLFARTN